MALNQAYQTGTVTAFSGASGLLTALLALIVGTEVTGEVLATAANVSTTLANTPCAPGRMVVKYTISAVDYEATDDGQGNITGTNITAGSITYSTGAISVTFSSAPTGNVTGDYLYGDPGEDWREEVNRNTKDGELPPGEPFGSNCKEVILSNTGISGQEFVCIGIREWTYAAENAAGWNLNCYTWYNTDMDWNANKIDHGYDLYSSTWEQWYEMPTLPLIDDTMNYWFFSNRQRIIVVAKVASQYEQMYLGFGRRFGNPSDYPYPYMIGGATAGLQNYATQTATHVGIHQGVLSDDQNPKMVYSPGGVWWGMSQQENQTAIFIEPRYGWTDSGTIAPTIAGRILMYPCYVCQTFVNECYFDLDGVHSVIGTGIQAEDTIDRGMRRSIVFPNIWRNTYYDHCAVEYLDITTTTTTTSTSTTTSAIETTTTTTTS